jgi:hypothetical protein
MPGVAEFPIANINLFKRERDMAVATVAYSNEEDLDGRTYTHHVKVEVRVPIPEDGNLRSLNEALVAKAAEQMRLILARLEDSQEPGPLSVAG